jgi:hypothetical protein
MFTFTGLSGTHTLSSLLLAAVCADGWAAPQVDRMVRVHHIYMTADGRISMAGLNARNVQYVADVRDPCCEGEGGRKLTVGAGDQGRRGQHQVSCRMRGACVV